MGGGGGREEEGGRGLRDVKKEEDDNEEGAEGKRRSKGWGKANEERLKRRGEKREKAHDKEQISDVAQNRRTEITSTNLGKGGDHPVELYPLPYPPLSLCHHRPICCMHNRDHYISSRYQQK